MTPKGNFLADFEAYYSYQTWKELETIFCAHFLEGDNLESALQKVAKTLQMGKDITLSRLKEKVLSRLALAIQLNMKLTQDWGKLCMNEKFVMEQIPDWSISMSHCAKGVATLVGSKKYGLGIDVEISTRSIDPQAYKYFKHAEDEKLDNSMLLKRWVEKEAAFKAIYHFQEKNFPDQEKIQALTQIRVNNHQHFSFQNLKGELKTKALETLYLSIACIKP